GLKLKRPVRADGPLELWLEDPRELYPFDQMNAAVMDLLARAIGVTLEPFRSGPFTRERVLDALKTSTPPCIVATIRKKRQALAALRVGDEALTPMNYLKAIEQWHNQARADARTS